MQRASLSTLYLTLQFRSTLFSDGSCLAAPFLQDSLALLHSHRSRTRVLPF